jgi:hypothetical protein
LQQIRYPKTKGIRSLIFDYIDEGRLGGICGEIGNTTGNTVRSLRTYRYNDFSLIQTMEDSLDYLSGGDRKRIKQYEYDKLLRVSKMTYADSKVLGGGTPKIHVKN